MDTHHSKKAASSYSSPLDTICEFCDRKCDALALPLHDELIRIYVDSDLIVCSFECLWASILFVMKQKNISNGAVSAIHKRVSSIANRGFIVPTTHPDSIIRLFHCQPNFPPPPTKTIDLSSTSFSNKKRTRD